MARRAKRYWLLKSEPGEYSIDDLERDGRTGWDGVRNYQARNFLRDDMKEGDEVLYYHSSLTPPGVVGLARVVGEPYPDPTQFEAGHHHHDPKSDPDDPRWWQVDVEFVRKFPGTIPIADLKANPKLEGMLVTKRGQRLSVQPVDKPHFQAVVRMAKSKQSPGVRVP